VAPLLAEAEFTFDFKEPNNLPNPMLAISEASFGYMVDGTPKTIVQGVSKSVLAGQRIGILGANGQGKSTLVKTIARTMPLLAGTLTEGKGLNIGYFAQQELDVLHPQDNPLEHMVRLAKELGPQSGEPSREQDLRNYLGTFNFSGDMVKQAVGTMSGGEKARLVLAMIVWQRPNLLLLDEPTNHLDLATREALSMALNEFEGTVMLVSHDRALLRAVCDEFWMVGRGKVEPFDGDLDDYQRYLLEESKRLREEAKGASSAAPMQPQPEKESPAIKASELETTPTLSAAEQRKLEAQRRQQLATQLRPFKKELEQNEQRMAVIEQEKSDLEMQLSGPLPSTEIAEAGRRLKALSDEMAALEERWMWLSEKLQDLQTQA